MSWSLVGLEDLGRASAVTDDVAWIEACARTGSAEPVILKRGDTLLPLCRRRRHGLLFLEALGQTSRSTAGPVGAGGDDCWTLTPRDLPLKADLVDIRRFPADLADRMFPDSPGRLVRPDILHFGRPLEDSRDAFLDNLSKGTRKDLRYCLNRVEKTFGAGGVRHESVGLDAANWDKTWRQAEEFSRYTWQGKAGVSVLTNPGKRRFLSCLAAKGMTVTVHAYRLGDDVAAMAITMRNNGQILIYSHEYHVDFAKYQPGHLLNYLIISEAIADGISSLDFGVGETQHKYSWRCDPKPLWRIMTPLTWKGWLALAYQQARWRVGAIFTRRTGS